MLVTRSALAWLAGHGGEAGLPAFGQALLEQRFDAREAFGDAGGVAGQPGLDCGDAFMDSVDPVAVLVDARADDADGGHEHDRDDRDGLGRRGLRHRRGRGKVELGERGRRLRFEAGFEQFVVEVRGRGSHGQSLPVRGSGNGARGAVRHNLHPAANSSEPDPLAWACVHGAYRCDLDYRHLEAERELAGRRHGWDPGRGVRNRRSVADLDAIAVQIPLEPAALAVVERMPREAVEDFAHDECPKLGSRALVEPAPDGLEALAQQVVGAEARYERDVEGFGLERGELGAQAFPAGVAGWERGRGCGHRGVVRPGGRRGYGRGVVRAGLCRRPGRRSWSSGLDACRGSKTGEGGRRYRRRDLGGAAGPRNAGAGRIAGDSVGRLWTRSRSWGRGRNRHS